MAEGGKAKEEIVVEEVRNEIRNGTRSMMLGPVFYPRSLESGAKF
jgi:hypothetical protein